MPHQKHPVFHLQMKKRTDLAITHQIRSLHHFTCIPAQFRNKRKPPSPRGIALALLGRGKACAAIDGAITLGHKRHRGGRATLRAGRFVLLARRRSTIVFARLAAILATGRLVLEAFFCIELLLARGEHEFSAAIAAG